MTKASIWSSAAYARVGVSKAQASAISIIKRNAAVIRENRPPTCQARSLADARSCTISSLSPIARSEGPFGLPPRFTGRNSVAFVVLPLAGSQRDLDLGV